MSCKPTETCRILMLLSSLYIFCVCEKRFSSHAYTLMMTDPSELASHVLQISLAELGFDDHFITPLRENYLNPICRVLYPEWIGDALDSHKAFVVVYKEGQDVDLATHYDNAEVTLNVCLGKNFDEGSLYFGSMRNASSSDDFLEYRHCKSVGVLHRGQQLHGAMPIQDGERYNLIIWMRSSSVRNQLCPMCDQPPDLEPVKHGFGDGFSLVQENVCVVN